MEATAHQVPEDAFAAYVLGYTCANDVTADDWRPDGPWVRAKSADTEARCCPTWIASAASPYAPDNAVNNSSPVTARSTSAPALPRTPGRRCGSLRCRRPAARCRLRPRP